MVNRQNHGQKLRYAVHISPRPRRLKYFSKVCYLAGAVNHPVLRPQNHLKPILAMVVRRKEGRIYILKSRIFFCCRAHVVLIYLGKSSTCLGQQIIDCYNLQCTIVTKLSFQLTWTLPQDSHSKIFKTERGCQSSPCKIMINNSISNNVGVGVFACKIWWFALHSIRVF